MSTFNNKIYAATTAKARNAGKDTLLLMLSLAEIAAEKAQAQISAYKYLLESKYDIRK